MHARTPQDLAWYLGAHDRYTEVPSADGQWLTVRFLLPAIRDPAFFTELSKVTAWKHEVEAWTVSESPKGTLVPSRLTWWTFLKVKFLKLLSARKERKEQRAAVRYFSRDAIHERALASEIKPSVLKQS